MTPKLITSFMLLLTLFAAGCGEKRRPIPIVQTQHKAIQKAKPKVKQGRPRLIEAFSDSLNIARKGFNKITLKNYEIADSSEVVIQFFSKQNNKWAIKNYFHFPKNEFISCHPQIANFNNDGLKDFTYVSEIAARGGNEIRTLFIYDKKNDELMLIKNSDTFPNLSYNKQLNCIESLGLSGCSTTSFANIASDSLKEFARAEQCDSITVYAYDRNGIEKIILKRSINAHEDMVFTDYNLLKKYSKRQP